MSISIKCMFPKTKWMRAYKFSLLFWRQRLLKIRFRCLFFMTSVWHLSNFWLLLKKGGVLFLCRYRCNSSHHGRARLLLLSSLLHLLLHLLLALHHLQQHKHGYYQNENPPFKGGNLGDHQPTAQHGDGCGQECRNGQRAGSETSSAHERSVQEGKRTGQAANVVGPN